MFDSLCTRFECPISTSTGKGVARTFAGEGGVILKMKRDSKKTRCFDPVNAGFEKKKHEKERIVVGSSLRIVDICDVAKNKWHKSYISALKMFEQIVSGHFIDGGENTAKKLLSLVKAVTQNDCAAIIDETVAVAQGTTLLFLQTI